MPRPRLTEVDLPAVPSFLYWRDNSGKRVKAPVQDFTDEELADIALCWASRFLARAVEQSEMG